MVAADPGERGLVLLPVPLVDERDARASTGKKKMRLVILSEVLTAQLWLRAHATMGDMAVEIEE